MNFFKKKKRSWTLLYCVSFVVSCMSCHKFNSPILTVAVGLLRQCGAKWMDELLESYLLL